MAQKSKLHAELFMHYRVASTVGLSKVDIFAFRCKTCSTDFHIDRKPVFCPQCGWKGNTMLRDGVMFYEGMIASLAVVYARGIDTLFDEIVNTVNKDYLIACARTSGSMRLSGLSDYLRRKKAEATRG